MLDDKDFREDLTHGDTQTQAEQGETALDPALIPGYSAEEKPTTTDLPSGQSIEMDPGLADTGKEPEGSAPAPEGAPSTTHGEEPDEKQLMQNVLTAVRELTEEVNRLRLRIEENSYDPAHYPSERTPGLAAVSEDGGESETKPEKKNKVLSVISSVLFYVVIVAMVLGAFLMRSTSKGQPFMIAGFSAANVLTSSMEDVYPRGSLIITRQVDAKDLQIGDDITFMVSEDSSITHRIIGITENYQGTGERAFRTQGTKNPDPDKEMVAAANVVGKVIFHSKALGDFANFVKENWPILIFVLIVIIALISFLKWNAKKSDEDDEAPKKQKKLSERRSESNGDE